LSGTGTVVFGMYGTNFNVLEIGAPSTTLTIGPGITIRGSYGTLEGTTSTDAIINQGTISGDESGGLVGGFVYDTDFSGGITDSTSTLINTSGATNPAPEAVYQTERYGNSTYTLPNLTPGTSYTVQLDFADFVATAAGQQLMNVTINGTQVLTSFDVFATAGAEYKAVDETFTATANSSGQIVIAFTTASGSSYFCAVNGIELLSGGTPVLAINCGLLAGGAMTISPGGTFTNQGTVQALNGESLSISDLAPNAGVIAAGDGSVITINGNFSNSSTGTLIVDIGGTSTSQYGVIDVTGSASLAGTLDVSLQNGFSPAAGEDFNVMTFASETGTFSSIIGWPDNILYDPESVTLSS